MKVILSRKGFDSSYGGQPSPILPDGTLLSLPIPSLDDVKFSELYLKDKSYFDIIKELKPNTKIKDYYTSHLDPDIRKEATDRNADWKGLFGQWGAAQGHLRKQGIGINDIFLFFGWFKQTEQTDAGLRYVKGAPDLHVIYGYLQVGEIHTDLETLPSFGLKHPHTNMYGSHINNIIYEANQNLSFNAKIPGYNTLNYHKNLVLTKDGYSRSKWNLPDFFKDVNISYHTEKSFKDEYFDSAKKGQEFVIDGSDDVLKWVEGVIGS